MILSSIFSWISSKSYGGGSKYMLCILAYALRWNLTTYNELIDKKNKQATYVHLVHGIDRISHKNLPVKKYTTKIMK